MQTRPNRVWIVVFLLGFAFDFLFWKHAPGINFAVFVALCLGLGSWLLWQGGAKPARTSLLVVAPAVFLAAMTFIRQEPMTTFLNYALTLACLLLLVMTWQGGRWLAYSLSDYVAGTFRVIGSLFARGGTFAVETRREAGEGGRRGSRRVWAVLRGLLIALPVVAVFASLLASADLIFARHLDDFIALFRLERLPEYIFRGVYIAVLAYFLAGVLLHAAQASRDEKLIGEQKPLVAPFLGFTESSIVLGSLVALFAAFVAVQFQYFFGGQANISLDGYTYSEYARRGFGELIAVAFFSLLVLLSLAGATRREARGQRIAFSALGGGLVALVLVMLVSAFQRLVLYEQAYGFSRLRAYTHVFMIWLALLLVAVVLLEVLRKQRAFALAAALTALGFVVSLNLVSVDGLTARQNVARVTQGEIFDAGYLATLSADAIPALADAFQDPDLDVRAQEAAGAALVCWRESQAGREDESWQAFHLADWRAARLLAGLTPALSGYKIQDQGGWLPQVTTPGGERYDCASYYHD